MKNFIILPSLSFASLLLEEGGGGEKKKGMIFTVVMVCVTAKPS